jgi:hypothetical protein
MSYSAIVTRVNTRPHPNANKIQLGLIGGNQVVVGLDVADKTLGVFFPTDGQLSDAMCRANGLYSESACNKLGITGQTHFGFFSDNRRVRAQKFRGEKSDGFWTELTALAWTGVDLSKLKEGDEFTDLNGEPVCNKYYTPATLRAQAHAAKQGKKPINVIFPKHVDTSQFRYVANLPENAVCYITEKMHGTSGRYGHVLETLEPTRMQRVWDWFFGKQKRRTWRYFNGSKNVTLERTVGAGYYGTNDFRLAATEGITLHKGEVLYFELVGYFAEGRPIMPPHEISDKETKALYGDKMAYRYGTKDGECALYVYRITRLNEDGIETDLPWPQVLRRCEELNLKTVQALTTPFIYNGEIGSLRNIVEALTEGQSMFDPTHIREGVVLRVESDRGTSFYKNKSFTFGVLEGYIKDKDDYVDTEEAA